MIYHNEDRENLCDFNNINAADDEADAWYYKNLSDDHNDNFVVQENENYNNAYDEDDAALQE